jgi:peptidoglycan/LPS O-acetylase OafA/YrhL
MASQQNDPGERDLSSRLVAGLKTVIGDDRPFVASPRLRVTFLAVAAATLALWIASLIPAIQNWNNQNEDGFSMIPAFYASFTMVPVGLFLMAGAIIGRGKWTAHARKALVIGIALVCLVIAFKMLQFFANGPDG